MLDERGVDAHLSLHGANLELQPPRRSRRSSPSCSTRQGTGRQRDACAAATTTSDLPRLMAEVDWVVVPSLWWENSPLVIQEAFLHGRPVICSDIGGMAEKVTDGVNGLHFRAGDRAQPRARDRDGGRRRRACGSSCAPASPTSTTWTIHVASLGRCTGSSWSAERQRSHEVAR